MCKDRGAVSVLQPWDRARKKGPTGIQMGGQRLRFQGRAGKQERVWARGMKKVGEVLGEKGYQQGHGLPLLTPAWQRAFKITRSAFQKPAIPGEKIHASLLRAGCTPRCKPGVPGSRTTPANTPRAPGPRPPAKPPADWAPGCAAAGTIEGMAELGPLWEGGHIAKGPCPQAQTLGSLVGRPRPIAPPYLGAEGAARQRQRGSAGALAPAGPHALQEPRSALPLASPSCASLGHGPASGGGSSSPTDTPSRPGLRPPQSCSGHLRPPAPPRHCLISSHTLLSAPKAGFGFGFDSAALIPRPSAPACHHRTLQPLFPHSGFSEVPSQTGPAQGVPRLRA